MSCETNRLGRIQVCGVSLISGKIDQHNTLRQGSMMLELKLETTLWWHIVNMLLFGMCVVDAYLLAQATVGFPL